MKNNKESTDRFHVFPCSPGESAHRGNPAELQVKFFSGQAKLRSHAVKHLANSYEMDVWKKIVDFDHNSISKTIDALKDVECPFFTLATDSPPCWTCRKYTVCPGSVQDLVEIYQQCITAAIQAGLSIPRNVCFDWNDKGQEKEDYWIVPDMPVAIKMNRFKGRYVVVTSFFPKAGTNASFKERIGGLSWEICNKAHRNTIIWCTENTWETPVCHDGRKRKNMNRKSKQKTARKKTGQNRPQKKERGGSKNLTAFYNQDEE